MSKPTLYFICSVLLMLLTIACSNSHQIDSSTYTAPATTVKPDYSSLYYWAAHPDKKDPSDSTPAPYRNFVPDNTVDVFFVHPTTYTDPGLVHANLLPLPTEIRLWNADINNPDLNAKTDYSTILMQASVFNQYRVFAPRYRQAHLQSFYISDSLSKPFFDRAYTDVKEAFNYYLTHFNQGRPFIIASHSQGTVHAAHLIKDTIENTSLSKQLVAAYLIGMPVAQNYFTNCLPCSAPSQTGCFITWRTFKKGYTPTNIANENYKSWVINPLTWTTDSIAAPKTLNKGAVLFNFNKKSKGVSAQAAGNILWASKPHFFGSIFFTRKNYHIGDINVFCNNISEIVSDRVNAFKSSNVNTTPIEPKP
jgi:hypothetical protein